MDCGRNLSASMQFKKVLVANWLAVGRRKSGRMFARAIQSHKLNR